MESGGSRSRQAAVRRGRHLVGRAALGFVLAIMLGAGTLWAYGGSYALHVVLRYGGTYWLPVAPDSARMSPAMRLALAAAPIATPGALDWRRLDEGFAVGELPVIAGDREVDRVLLARIDPTRFRFVVANAPSGDKDLDQWMTTLGAALVVNGSYYARRGTPDTPLLSDGVLLGPRDYDAKAGAFVASAATASIRDLAHEDWRDAFRGAENAMVSYPLLVAKDEVRVAGTSRWLANRSFIGEDEEGRIVIGTTRGAFFSLDRLASFLLASPLRLTIALNLDGGPVACQGISFKGFERRSYGRWELQATGDHASLLTWPYGTIAMPIVLAVYPK
jgi:hypothetical protein